MATNSIPLNKRLAHAIANRLPLLLCSASLFSGMNTIFAQDGRIRLPSAYMSVTHLSCAQGASVLACTNESHLYIWDYQIGREISHVDTHEMISSVDIAADGGTVLSGGAEGTVQFWNARTGKELSQCSRQGEITGLSLSGDGAIGLVRCDENTVIAYDRHCRVLWQKELKKDPVCAAISPDGATAAIGDYEGHLSFYNAQSGQLLKQRHMHKSGIRKLRYSSSGSYLASCDIGGGVVVYDVKCDGIKCRCKSATATYCIGISSDDKRLATGTGSISKFRRPQKDGIVMVWDIDNGILIQKLPVDPDQVKVLSFTRQPRGLVISADDRLKIYSVE